MVLEDEIYQKRFDPAEYRVRLFLSADLSGSTSFKNSKIGEDRSENYTPKWVTLFQQFYTDFPARYRTNYQNHVTPRIGRPACPEVWKAVGDELVFCGRARNKRSICVSLSAFIDTIHEYRKDLIQNDVDLNIKGAGWLAAFPEPNRAVKLRRENREHDLISASEALECAADRHPFDYDFIGKAIDTGFRVASTASPERFAISVQLARILVSDPERLGFSHTVRFDHPKLLKGVNRGEPYPFLYIDTMDHLRTKKIRKKEREILYPNQNQNRDVISDYLDEYCQVVGTDEIILPIDTADSATTEPEIYTQHREKIAEHLTQEKDREFADSMPQGETPGEESDILPKDEELKPLLDSE